MNEKARSSPVTHGGDPTGEVHPDSVPPSVSKYLEKKVDAALIDVTMLKIRGPLGYGGVFLFFPGVFRKFFCLVCRGL